jgi:archaellum biogenesis ATPase FlaH
MKILTKKEVQLDNIKDVYNSTGLGSQDNPYRNMITAKEMLENDITEIPMLWGHFLPKQGLAVISGNSDTGKSTLMRQLSAAIVSEQDQFLGYDLNTDRKSVVYVCTEDDVTSVSTRLKKEFDGTTSTDPYANLRYIFDEDDILTQLEKTIAEKPADCIILDALGDIFQGDMNNMTSVRSFFKPFKALAERNNCLIILVAHNRKSASANAGKADVLGSQAFEAKPRAVLMLCPVSGSPIKELSISKGNFVPEELKKTRLQIQINSDGVFEVVSRLQGFTQKNPDEEKMLDRIVALRKQDFSSRKIAEVVNAEGMKIKKSKIAELLKKIGLEEKESDD